MFAKGRSCYTFQLVGDTNQVNQLVQNYMTSNNYVLKQENGESYYVSKNPTFGDRYFNYILSGNTLTIYAWVIIASSEVAIDQKGPASVNMAIMDYRNSLNDLFKEIEKTNDNVNNNSTANVFEDEAIRKRETMCEIGFWLSIFGFIISFFGIVPVVILVVDSLFAIQGLKTRKKWKAIVTIILSTLSAIISIVVLLIIEMYWR